MLRILTVAGLILPLSLDTFVLGTALGAAGIAKQERLRMSLILTAFEAGMPVIGFLAGAGLGIAVGGLANYAAAGVLAAVGVLMLWRQGDEDEEQKVRLLESARGWAVLVLGLGISVDELAIGFGMGLLRLPFLLLIALIAVQAFLAAQLGMRLGSRVAENAREAAGRIAGGLLILAALLLVGEHIAGV
ncbi:MAG TPA: manganese efflux pump [Candidatus Micrarchaeaceae archaeon]|nr:manganese efflux pump [Candidatus Micrarchaeaceae archaeon]